MVSKGKMGIDVMGTLRTPTHPHQRVQQLGIANSGSAGMGTLQTPILRRHVDGGAVGHDGTAAGAPASTSIAMATQLRKWA